MSPPARPAKQSPTQSPTQRAELLRQPCGLARNNSVPGRPPFLHQVHMSGPSAELPVGGGRQSAAWQWNGRDQIAGPSRTTQARNAPTIVGYAPIVWRLPWGPISAIMGAVRGVAQPGSALEWGSSGRRFKSSRPDSKPSAAKVLRAFLCIVAWPIARSLFGPWCACSRHGAPSQRCDGLFADRHFPTEGARCRGASNCSRATGNPA